MPASRTGTPGCRSLSGERKNPEAASEQSRARQNREARVVYIPVISDERYWCSWARADNFSPNLCRHSLQLFLGAELDAGNFTVSRVAHDDLRCPVASRKRNVAECDPVRRQRVLGPLLRLRIKLGHRVPGGEIDPHVVVLVDRRIWARTRVSGTDRKWVLRYGCELCEIPTPVIAHPHRIAILVRSHSTRPPRPEPGEVCEFHASEGQSLRSSSVIAPSALAARAGTLNSLDSPVRASALSTRSMWIWVHHPLSSRSTDIPLFLPAHCQRVSLI